MSEIQHMTCMNHGAPIEVLSFGAGVQSSAIALMAAHGEIQPPHCAVFADTQAEPSYVYQWLDHISTLLPFPLIRVTNGSLYDESLKLKRNAKTGKPYISWMVPAFTMDNGRKGMMRRQCTDKAKIVPIIRYLKELRTQHGASHIITWLGISLDEAHRMRDSRYRWIHNRYPLIEKRMTRRDCLLWLERHGYPQPKRSACVFCPYRSGSEWQTLMKHDPEGFDRAVRYEAALQERFQSITLRSIPYLHPRRIPLSEAIRTTPDDLDLFGNECTGLCGV